MDPVHRESAGGRSPSGGLLAVHAHPDDETLATGGLLATWADAGLPVTVVTCTRGELGEVIGAALAHLEGDGPALAAHRELELAGALAALGVTDHVFLDAVPDGVFLDAVPDGVFPDAVPDGVFPDAVPDGDLPHQGERARFSDSGMAWAGIGRAGRVADLPDGAFVAVPLDAAARRLARVLRERRPDVVVTYEPGGGYGHPDHVRAHDVTMRAIELAGDAELDLGGPAHVPDAVLVAVVPVDALRAAYRALPGLPAVAAFRAGDPKLTLPDPDGPLPSVAVPTSEVDMVVDVTPVLDRLAAALAAHATQVRSIALDADRLTRAAAADRQGDRTGTIVGCYALSNDVLLPVLSTESYRLAPRSTPRRLTWPDAVHPVA